MSQEERYEEYVDFDNATFEEEDFITLEFDEGEDLNCLMLGNFFAEYKGEEREYIALYDFSFDEYEKLGKSLKRKPILSDLPEKDVFIYRYNEDEAGETFTITDVEDDKEFEVAEKAFIETMEEMGE